MADAVAIKQHVIPRSLLDITINGSGLLAQPPIEGIVTLVGAGPAASVLWENGLLVSGLDVTNDTVSPLLRIAAASAGTQTTFAGQVVQLIGGNPEFSGPVVQVLSIELDPSDPNVYTDCVIVRSRGPSQAFFVAEATLVDVVD